MVENNRDTFENKENELVRERKNKESYHVVFNKDEMIKRIRKLPKHTRVTPGTLGMTGAKNNFYRWAKVIDEIKKVGSHYYVV